MVQPNNIKKNIIKNNPKLEYEAFAMNELCHFHGAFCSSLHCDELCHMCHVPYKIGNVYDKHEENCDDKIDKEKRKDLDEEFDEELEYSIVGTTEADPDKNNISDESPVGKALIGRSDGEIVDVDALVDRFRKRVIWIKDSHKDQALEKHPELNLDEYVTKEELADMYTLTDKKPQE